MHFEQQAEVLNDLVKINNDRVEGYKKAVDNLEADDADLKIVFQEKINESLIMKVNELVSLENMQYVAAQSGLEYNNNNIIVINK